MAEVTAALVKELRDKTNAGMMDCKRALQETGGEIEPAIDWLRKKGIASAEKKTGRVAAEGLVGVATRGVVGAIIEVNAETDFVARNDLFQALVRGVAALAVDARDVEALKAMAYPGTGRTVAEELTELIGRIGENMVLRRAARLAVGRGQVASYAHNALGPGLGKIGVLVALESEAPDDALATLGRQLAMHVAFGNPQYLDIGAVPAAALERERAVLLEQARSTARTEEIAERMVDGRLRKFYEETVLLEQIFVSPDADGKSRVGQVVEAAAKAAGKPIRVTGFVRFALGEGIDKPTTDLAADVAAQLKH